MFIIISRIQNIVFFIIFKEKMDLSKDFANISMFSKLEHKKTGVNKKGRRRP